MSSLHLKRAVEAGKKNLVKTGEVASNSICQASRPAAPPLSSQGATLKCGTPSGSQINNTCQFWGLEVRRQVYPSSARQEKSPNPRPYAHTESWERALALRRFQTRGGVTQILTRSQGSKTKTIRHGGESMAENKKVWPQHQALRHQAGLCLNSKSLPFLTPGTLDHTACLLPKKIKS